MPLTKLYLGNIEPSIDELLNDDIARLLRVRDRLHVDNVLRIIERARDARRGTDSTEVGDGEVQDDTSP